IITRTLRNDDKMQASGIILLDHARNLRHFPSDTVLNRGRRKRRNSQIQPDAWAIYDPIRQERQPRLTVSHRLARPCGANITAKPVSYPRNQYQAKSA